MPYVSDAQRGYFNANRARLEKEGVDVDEWNKSSAGMKLPARAKSSTGPSIGTGYPVKYRKKKKDGNSQT